MAKGPKLTEEQKKRRRKLRRAIRQAQEDQEADDFAWFKARRELGEYLDAIETKFPELKGRAPDPWVEQFSEQIRRVAADRNARRKQKLEALRAAFRAV